MKERLEYVDQIRGIAILLVIIGHLIEFNQIGGGYNNPVFNAIYAFHMPLFFMISGYIGSKTSRVSSLNQYIPFLVKKARILILPYLAWKLVVNQLFLTAGWGHLTSFREIESTFLHPGLLWFLPMLFEIFIFYGLFLIFSNKLNKKNYLFIDLLLWSFIMLIIITGIFFIDKAHFTSLALFSFSFYVGVFIAKYEGIEKLMLSRIIFLLSTVAFLIFLCHWQTAGTSIDDLLKVIISVTAFISIMNVCRRVRWNDMVNKQLMLFGRESLVIYVVHFHLILLNIDFLKSFNLNSFLLFVGLLVLAIFIAYLCIGFARLIQLSPLLELMLFGKKHNYHPPKTL